MFVNGSHHQEYAKLEYGRLLWRDPRQPHAGRFAEHEADVRHLLDSPKGSDAELDAELQQRGLSLRVVVKETTSVFGSFF